MEPTTPSSPAASETAVPDRYAKYYKIAGTVIRDGWTIKVVFTVLCLVGSVAALLLSLPVWVFASALSASFSTYLLGVLVSTQGRQLAMLTDSAVNTSPLLTVEQARHLVAD